MEKIKCTRCKKHLDKDMYFFNKKRSKVDQPCKSCRAGSKRLRRLEMKINGKFHKSELEKSYRLKGVPDELIEVIVAKILLNREIDKSISPQATGNDKNVVLYCPNCCEVEVLDNPILLDDMVSIINHFKQVHGKCQKK